MTRKVPMSGAGAAASPAATGAGPPVSTGAAAARKAKARNTLPKPLMVSSVRARARRASKTPPARAARGEDIRAATNTTVSEALPHIRHRAVKQRSGVDDGGLGGAVRELRRAAGRRAGPRGPARPAAGLLHGPAAADSRTRRNGLSEADLDVLAKLAAQR